MQSACVLCSNGCALDIAVVDGRMVGARRRAVDRVNHGRLGPKGLYGWQANRVRDLWVIAGQGAKASRGRELLEVVRECHTETEIQAKWLLTRIKVAAPQVLMS